MLAMRQPVRTNRSRAPVVGNVAVPAPVEGWDASSPLAAMKPARAIQLTNWFPQPGWIEVRRGSRVHAHGMGASTPVESLMVWQGPASSKMFAAAGSVIYDVTTNASATSVVTGLQNARLQWVNQTTSGGHYLWVCNGADDAAHYNGSSWASPSLTGVTSADIVHVNVHKKRMWFTVIDSTAAYYLGVDAVAGAASEFELGSNFTRGGYLLAMATWTRDGGAGADDLAVFISSRGQIAVYQGTDPASADTWGLVGVFDVPIPIGRRCFAKWGGDLLVITQEGVFQLSKLLAVDQSQTRGLSVTERISQAFNTQSRLWRGNFGWEVLSYPLGTMLIVNIPTDENAAATQYVMNTLTGAWCDFTGWNANCFVTYEDRLYFGSNDGKVILADTGSTDDAESITAIGQTAYNAFGSPGRLKRMSLIRPLITTSGTGRPLIGMSVDFAETSYVSSLSSAGTSGGAVWDTAVWDVDVWPDAEQQITDWAAVNALGTVGSVKFQATTGAGIEGDGVWGVGLWGSALWGNIITSEEVMKINGFVILAERGHYL